VQTTPTSEGRTGDQHSPEAEGRYHRYFTNRIPWYVHLLWLGFWMLAVGYVLSFLFPAIREAFPARP
jgi:hypothetical protein